jgi:hypothetical protein
MYRLLHYWYRTNNTSTTYLLNPKNEKRNGTKRNETLDDSA